MRQMGWLPSRQTRDRVDSALHTQEERKGWNGERKRRKMEGKSVEYADSLASFYAIFPNHETGRSGRSFNPRCPPRSITVRTLCPFSMSWLCSYRASSAMKMYLHIYESSLSAWDCCTASVRNSWHLNGIASAKCASFTKQILRQRSAVSSWFLTRMCLHKHVANDTSVRDLTSSSHNKK